MLKRIHITGYKSLRDTRVAFTGPLTLVIGQNAAGKSNIFDVLALCSRIVTQRTLQDAFKAHRGAPLEAFSFGEAGIRGLLDQEAVELQIIVEVELSSAVTDKIERDIRSLRAEIDDEASNGGDAARAIAWERDLRYTLRVQMRTQEGLLRVINEELVALRKDGSPKTGRQPFIGPAKIQPNKLSLRLEGQAHPTNYDVGLDYALASLPLYAPHYPHITAFREELSRWRFYYLEPRAMREQAALKIVTSLGADGADLAAFYNTMKVQQPLKFQQIQHELRLMIPQIDAFDVERTDEGFLVMLVREAGVTYSSRVISEGTLRILGLLALTNPLTPLSLIGMEEPENGVHPHRLHLIADHMRNIARLRNGAFQILLNSHSPALPQYFPESTVLLCRQGEDGTTCIPQAEGALFRQPKYMEGVIDDEGTPVGERIVRGDYGG